VEARVLAQDAQLELLQRGPRVDAELLDERPPSALEDGERLRLPVAAIQREHQLAAETLAKSVLRDERLELRPQLLIAPEREVARARVLDARQTKPPQRGDLASRERLVPQVGQRLSTPERQRLAQARRSGLRIVPRSRLRGQRLETGDVDLVRGDLQQVP